MSDSWSGVEADQAVDDVARGVFEGLAQCDRPLAEQIEGLVQSTCGLDGDHPGRLGHPRTLGTLRFGHAASTICRCMYSARG
jgi:hypothetical protein